MYRHLDGSGLMGHNDVSDQDLDSAILIRWNVNKFYDRTAGILSLVRLWNTTELSVPDLCRAVRQ